MVYLIILYYLSQIEAALKKEVVESVINKVVAAVMFFVSVIPFVYTITQVMIKILWWILVSHMYERHLIAIKSDDVNVHFPYNICL